MAPAVCHRCGWARDYTRPSKAEIGLARHLARQCRPATVGMLGRGTPLTDELARERVALARLPLERTPVEWLAHPYALDDLMRVLGGTSVAKITHERRQLRQLQEGAA